MTGRKRGGPVGNRCREGRGVADVEVYEIDVRPTHFGRIRCRWPEAALESPSDTCYAVRYGARVPCHDCPAAALTPRRRAVTHIVPVEGAPGAYDVVSALYVDAETARLTVRRIDEELISGLVRARLDRLAREAKLTPREQEILPYLLMGRTFAQIGRCLGISPRTVKFHQLNLLHKLGADARTDLPRLLL